MGAIVIGLLRRRRLLRRRSCSRTSSATTTRSTSSASTASAAPSAPSSPASSPPRPSTPQAPTACSAAASTSCSTRRSSAWSRRPRFSFVVTCVILKVLDKTIGLRVTPERGARRARRHAARRERLRDGRLDRRQRPARRGLTRRPRARRPTRSSRPQLRRVAGRTAPRVAARTAPAPLCSRSGALLQLPSRRSAHGHPSARDPHQRTGRRGACACARSSCPRTSRTAPRRPPTKRSSWRAPLAPRSRCSTSGRCPPTPSSPTGRTQPSPALEEAIRHDTSEALEEEARRLAARGLQPATEEIEGSPYEAIVRFAHERGFDLDRDGDPWPPRAVALPARLGRRAGRPARAHPGADDAFARRGRRSPPSTAMTEAARRASPCRVNTGTCAVRTTRSATEPRASQSSPRRPCVPTTIRSKSCSSA